MTGGRDARAERLTLRNRRARLLSPLTTIEQLSEGLLRQEVGVSEIAKVDLRRIRDAARVLCQMALQLLPPSDPPPVSGEAELAVRRVELTLRNKLSIICGYCDELILKDNAPVILHEELNTLSDLATHCLDIGDRLVAFLSNPAEHPQEGIDWSAVTAHMAAPGHVLVVDDDHLLRGLLARRLTKLNHLVEEADGGAGTIQKIHSSSSPFDLIILEILTPPPGGVEFLRTLKADPLTRELPVLVVSGDDDQDARVRCVELGADDFLPKPPDAALLRARVNSCLEAYRTRRRLHKVLIDTFPRQIAESLGKGDWPELKDVPDVAVLFADIEGFTAYSGQFRKTPLSVVKYLEHLFRAWDEIADKNHVQKIKTIGDGYMGASGLFGEPGDHILNCVSCGLEMIQEVFKYPPGAEKPWKLRVGVDVGTVTAGLLGATHYLYDVWGDTVNTASRMESNGRANCVSLSSRAYKRIAGKVPGADHSHVTPKGKDTEMIIYHVDLDLEPTVKLALSRQRDSHDRIQADAHL